MLYNLKMSCHTGYLYIYPVRIEFHSALPHGTYYSAPVGIGTIHGTLYKIGGHYSLCQMPCIVLIRHTRHIHLKHLGSALSVRGYRPDKCSVDISYRFDKCRKVFIGLQQFLVTRHTICKYHYRVICRHVSIHRHHIVCIDHI